MPEPRTADEVTLSAVVGSETFRRALEYARSGAVLSTQTAPSNAHAFGEVAGSARTPYSAVAFLSRAADGRLTGFRGSCTCPVHLNCKHSVAVALATVIERSDAPPAATVTPIFAPWERHLLDLVNEPPDADDGSAAIGLQFELTVPLRMNRRPAQPAQIGLRPVVPGKNGQWVRSGISWTGIGYGGSGLTRLPRAQLGLLEEIAALDAASRRSYSYGANPPISLTTFGSRRIWDLLDEAHALGMPFLQANKPPSPVVLVGDPAELQLDLTRVPSGMLLRPQVRSGDETRTLESAVLTGSPAHGIAWWSDDDGGRAPLYLARLATTVPPSVRTIVDQAELTVPAEQEERFFSRYYPALRERVS
ncbi:MAG: hypothetical protein QOJ32_1822, partial [Frankiaceae bacterium]|nr:hypothetical protein [Frankiaceae bacterium]